jgi:serine/threonine-protein kinase
MRALARDPEARFSTALQMAEALEAAGPVAPPGEVGAWVTRVAGDLLEERAARIAAVEARLVTGIRDSQHLIEGNGAPITRLDEGGGMTSLDVPLPAPMPPSAPPPPLAPSEPPPTLGKASPASTPPAAGPAEPSLNRGPGTFGDPIWSRGSGTLWIAAAALGAVAAVAAFAVIARVPSSDREGPAVAPEIASEAPPVSASTLDPAPRVAPAEPTPVPVVTTATATARATQARANGPAARPAVPANPPVAARRPDACSPPFTIDGEGHKHYKHECLR